MQEPKACDIDIGFARRNNDDARSHVASDDASTHLGVAHGGARASRSAGTVEFIDASASIHPLGPPHWLRQELERSIESLVHYPDPHCTALRQAIATRHDTSPERVVVANGTSELFAWLPIVTGDASYVVPVPSYGEYRRSPALAGRRVHPLPLGKAPDFALDFASLETLLAGTQTGHLETQQVVILGHPNNPTGKLLDVERFARLREQRPETLFVVDEAFADFAEDFVSTWDSSARNLLVLRSLTKNLAIPGLRLGYALGAAPLCARLRERMPPWSVNHLAQRVGERFFEEGTKELTERLSTLRSLKAEYVTELRKLPKIRVSDPAVNWVMLELTSPELRAQAVAKACLGHGVALRPCDDFLGLEGQWLRLSLRTRDENRRIVDTLRSVLGASASRPVVRRPRAILLGGCTSDAGKSLLATALCRCLKQDGFRVAPFKAQNMSNNAGIAADGGEMGRAQIVQAWAAGLAPDTRMNPVLLKPTSDRGAQVVLRGQVLGHHDVLGYHALRQRCLDAALDAYDDLAADHDVIVCEGAGSIGEMNLRQRDLTNLGFVEHREMPVVLVGDIDRGGVYASFVGHLEVLSESDRRHVRGFLVNRFRGDPNLLADAHQWVTRHTGRPVLGVVPYLKDLVLPREDRLSLESGQQRFGDPRAPLRLAVLAPPHVSNADDIEPLTLEADVFLYVVERPEQLGQPDALLLLGTKNTLGDLGHYRRIGMDRAIAQAHANGSEVIGICGGLQMLGDTIEDPEGVEALERHAPGLGLLPVMTRFSGAKCLRRCRGQHVPTGARFEGYEIHHGTTDFSRVAPLFVDDDGRVLGGGDLSRRVFGTYVHGLFDSDAYRSTFLDGLRARRGLVPLGSARKRYSLEPTFERIAEVFRSHVDYPAILRLMGLK